ncbi:EF-hand domain-containing protein [Alteromonas facilis]|uniref:EF-hand domain-containing protein n=1 Tax=Alteromonas facilis TaxID=2048004 RepID=UPI000C28E1C0|nr:EF-hand domain-containing protein [Alteromonas facilis]
MNKVQKLTTMFVCAASIQAMMMAPVQASADLLATLDTDQDGYISLKEAVSDAKLLENFGVIDTDEDGKISQEELAAASAAAKESE